MAGLGPQSALARFRAVRTPVTEESATWGDEQSAPRLTFRISAYLHNQRPPPRYVTSARGLVFKGQSVLVVRNRHVTHIWPGGRREKGERLSQTLPREVLEETGWTVARGSLLGFLHFRHLSARPPGYVYPYPDFLQVVHFVEALFFVAEAKLQEDYEVESAFRPIAEVQTLPLSAAERLYLHAALRRRVRPTP